MSGSPQTLLTGSHLTSTTYIRSHCTISLLICWQRVRSMLSSRTGRPTVCDADDSTGTDGWRDRMCADAANAEAEDDADDTLPADDIACRWRGMGCWADAVDIAAAGCAADACVTWGGCGGGWCWRGNAREWGGKRDSTIERRVSHSSDEHPSTDSVVSFGHTQVCETGGVARFWGEHEGWIVVIIPDS